MISEVEVVANVMNPLAFINNLHDEWTDDPQTVWWSLLSLSQCLQNFLEITLAQEVYRIV